MLKFATTTAKGEVTMEVLAGSVRTVATLAYVSRLVPAAKQFCRRGLTPWRRCVRTRRC